MVSYLRAGWDFISGIFQMLTSAVLMVASGLSGMQVIVMYMPAVVGAAALVSIAVLVLRFICLK